MTKDIYFIESKKGAIKIGISDNPVKRLSELQTGNSNELKLKYIIKDVPIIFEKHIHYICRNFHKKGEWFHKDVIDFLLKHPWYKENMLPMRL